MTAHRRTNNLGRFGLFAPLAALSLAGCGLNSVPTAEENVNAKWANVQSEYQRRSTFSQLVEKRRVMPSRKSIVLEVTRRRRCRRVT